MNIDKFISFCNEDWKEKICNWWKNISPVDKKSFLWIFVVLNLVFLWHTVSFYWGNHDWEQIKSGVHVFWSLFDGRWGAGIIQQIFNGDILPVWNNLFCFAGFTFAVILLAKYWELPKNTFIYSIFGLFIVLLPYTLPWLQFVRSETHFWNIFLIVAALVLSSDKNFYKQIIAFLFFYFCLGCYASMISCIMILFLGRCFLDVWFDNKTLSDIIKNRWQTALVILLSFLAFLATWFFMKQFNFIIPMQNVSTIALTAIFNKFLNLHISLKNSFLNPCPFIPAFLKLLSGLAIPIVICLMKNFSKKSVFLLSVLFICIFISTQITNILAVGDYSNQIRIDFFAIPYVYALFWAILLKTGKFFENIAILFMFLIILYSGLQDVRSQKVKYLDNLHDIKIYEDIINRIKINPAFDPDKKYNLLILGEVTDCCNTTFDIYNHDIENPKILGFNTWAPFISNWNAYEYFNFYEKNPYIDKMNWSDWCNPIKDDEIKTLDYDYILNKARPYPDKNSTFVDDNVIYIIFDWEELEKFKERIKTVK